VEAYFFGGPAEVLYSAFVVSLTATFSNSVHLKQNVVKPSNYLLKNLRLAAKSYQQIGSIGAAFL